MRVAALLLVLWVPLAAGAQQAPAAASPGVCLPLEAHQAILADLRELRGDGSPESGLRGRVRLLEAKLELQAAQLHDLALARDLAVQAKEAAQEALAAAVRGKREAEASRDAWHRSRVLWFAMGVVGSIAIAIVVDKVQE